MNNKLLWRGKTLGPLRLLAVSALCMGCADQTLDEGANIAGQDVGTFAEIVDIDLETLPAQVLDGDDFITRIDNRVPRSNYRYEYSGSQKNSDFCQAFFSVFENDERDFIRIVQTSGNRAHFGFDGRFRPYIEPADAKAILSSLDYAVTPWQDIPSDKAAAQLYELQTSEFIYSRHGEKQKAPVPDKTLAEFLESLPADFKPYELFQRYDIPNSNYSLFRYQPTISFDPNIAELTKLDEMSPSKFRSYKQHFYRTRVTYNKDRDKSSLQKHFVDFMTMGGFYFIGLGESDYGSNLLGSIYANRLDYNKPSGLKTGHDCFIEVYLTPRHKRPTISQ